MTLVAFNGRMIHPGWFHPAPWTRADFERVQREHPELFIVQKSPWWAIGRAA